MISCQFSFNCTLSTNLLFRTNKIVLTSFSHLHNYTIVKECKFLKLCIKGVISISIYVFLNLSTTDFTLNVQLNINKTWRIILFKDTYIYMLETNFLLNLLKSLRLFFTNAITEHKVKTINHHQVLHPHLYIYYT